MWILCTDCKRTWMVGGYQPCKVIGHHWASQNWAHGPYEPSDESYPPDVQGHRFTVKTVTKIDPEKMKAAIEAIGTVARDMAESLKPAYKSLYDRTTFADLKKHAEELAEELAAKAAEEELKEVFDDIAHSPLRQPDRIDLSGRVIERRREGLQVSVAQRRREADLVRERKDRSVLLPCRIVPGQGKHRSGHRS